MSYLPLCNIVLQHQYFSDGLAQSLRLVPAVQTQRQLQNARLLLKATKQGAVLLLDTSRRDITIACCEPVLTLYFLLYSADPLFGSYSLPLLQPQQLLYCDNRTLVPDDAALRLHTKPELGSAEIINADDARLAGVLPTKGKTLPVMLLALDITALHIAQLTADNAISYLLRFGCRQNIWRYYLCGSAFAQPLRIQDMAQQTRFIQQNDTRLANGRVAQVFDSAQPLKLQQFSPYRFQLITTVHGSEKILIKRLPVAVAGQIDKAVVNGVASNVSEIYLNY
ncbi:hypothetical protein [Rheinheimera oceanensis]|uniref:hypothetical protein n=1 Tax=Rheinheimera oceanensis TaxID=2817449 RepID=UPI001BFD5507|nr:hypothetical protein [Rheinheimera oceanensis]